MVLLVEVLSARNLLPTDSEGTAQPFVSLQLIQQVPKMHHPPLYTQPLPHTLRPIWNEAFSFNERHFVHGTTTAQFDVLHYKGRLQKSQPLGRAVWSDLATSSDVNETRWLQLEPYDGLSHTTGELRVCCRRDTERTFTFDSKLWFADEDVGLCSSQAPPNALLVAVEKCQLDPAMSSHRATARKCFSSAVLMTYGTQTHKTQVVATSVSPRFDETFQFVLLDTDNSITVTLLDADIDHIVGFAVLRWPDDVCLPDDCFPETTGCEARRWDLWSDSPHHTSTQHISKQAGSIWLAFRAIYDPALSDEDGPFFQDRVPPHFSPCNELRVAVLRCRALPAAYGGGVCSLSKRTVLRPNADPYVELRAGGVSAEKTHVQLRSLHPVFNETFAFELSDELSITVFNFNIVGSDDIIGECRLQHLRQRLKPGMTDQRWHSLGDGRGDIMLALQLVHNAALVFDPFAPSMPRCSGTTKNELRIALFKARDLRVDEVRLNGSLDRVRVEFEVGSCRFRHVSRTQACVSGSVEWRQIFVDRLIEDDDNCLETPLVLRATLIGVNVTLGRHCELGVLVLPLALLLRGHRYVGWQRLTRGDGELSLSVDWCHNPEIDYEPPFATAAEEAEFPIGPTWPRNELRVALIQGEEVPRIVKLISVSGDVVQEHTSGEATAAGVWKEEVSLNVPPADSLELRICGGDGKALVIKDLATLLADGRAHRGWYLLSARAKIEVVLQHRYEPAYDLSVPPSVESRDNNGNIATRTLRAAASRESIFDPCVMTEILGGVQAAPERRQPMMSIEPNDTLYAAVARGHVEAVRTHLARASAIWRLAHIVGERGSLRGRALIHEAALHGHDDLIMVLVREYGAQVTQRSLLGRETALHFAVKEGHRRAAFVLLQLGADVGAKDKYGKTPLHYATTRSVVSLLLVNGASPLARDNKGQLAVNSTLEPAVQRLLEDACQTERRVLCRATIETQHEKAAQRDSIVRARLAAKEREAVHRLHAELRRDYLAWRHGHISGNALEVRQHNRQRAAAVRQRLLSP